MKELGVLDEIEVTIVAEDTIGFDTPLMGRFGISMLLRLNARDIQKTILFDTNSAAKPVLNNLKLLGKNPQDISTIFLSHCHYDHTDGLAGILDALSRSVPVIAHPETFRPCFEINPDGMRMIGMGYHREELEQKGAEFVLVREPLKLMTGVMTTGEVQRVTSYEKLEDLYTLDGSRVVQDQELDDTALVLNTRRGLVIISGCAHAGIVNTILTAQRVAGIEKVLAVIGGLHFVDASEEKVENSILFLHENVDHVFAGHCTGFESCCKMNKVLQDRFHQITTGMTIRFSSDRAQPSISGMTTASRHNHRTLYE
jgi:7,8-dihydropterin-6-yl-methyl-4-(beta-D-ribofuranosyl)aminobenzene 5'-phosphate synthase